ncbi:hypothetical protein ABIF69_001552 [Bradyrhizobium japonicum]
MRSPQPFIVIQNGKPLFTVYAYTLAQARALVAAKVAGETIVVGQIRHRVGFAAGPVTRDGASR